MSVTLTPPETPSQATDTGPAPGRRRRVRVGPMLIGVLTLVVLTLVAYPVSRMALDTFVQEGRGTLAPFRDLLAARAIRSVFVDTVVYVGATVVVAGSLGAFLAWANERTDARLGWLAGILPVLPLIVPPIGSVIGYLMLFSSRSGMGNVVLRNLLGLDGNAGPVEIGNMVGLVAITAINLTPLAYLIIVSAFRNTDPALDEASRVAGASKVRTFFRVTLPTVGPGFASGALVVGIMAAGAFTYPFIIGTTGGVTTASVHVYRLFSTWPPQQGAAVALASILLVVIQLAVIAQMRLSRRQGRAVVAGKHGSSGMVRLGRWRWVVRGVLVAYLLAVVLPVLGLVLGSFLPFRGSGLSLSQLSLDSFREVLTNPLTRGALVNSFMIGALAATVGMAIAATLTYVSIRQQSRVSSLIDGVLYLPAAIPQTALAAAFLVAFTRPPLVLYGTIWMLLLAYLIAFLPQATAAASSTLSQMNRELSEASSVAGGNAMMTLRRVVFPQIAPGLFAGWVIVFFLAVNEVTVSALLAGIGTPVVGQVAIEYFTTGRMSEIAAIALIVTCITGTIVALVGRAVVHAYRPQGTVR